jgi:ABC-2 type transport system permease protein
MNEQNINTVSRSELNLVTGKWLRGFPSIYRKELATLFGTKRWIIQLLIWLTLIVALPTWITLSIPANILSGLQGRGAGILLALFGFGTTAMSIGSILLVQGTIIEEKLTKTLLWIFSKPLTASGFILGKFAAAAVFVALIIVGTPSIVAYMAAKIIGLPPVSSTWQYLVAVGMIYLSTMFFAALTMMVGTIFNHTRAVMSLALVVFFAGFFLPLIPQLRNVEPYTVWGLSEHAAATFAGNFPSSAWASMGSSIILTGVFLTLAIWRMQQHEL